MVSWEGRSEQEPPSLLSWSLTWKRVKVPGSKGPVAWTERWWWFRWGRAALREGLQRPA
jgi:hypothetical protein